MTELKAMGSENLQMAIRYYVRKKGICFRVKGLFTQSNHLPSRELRIIFIGCFVLLFLIYCHSEGDEETDDEMNQETAKQRRGKEIQEDLSFR